MDKKAILAFLHSDDEWLAEIIGKYPRQIPIKPIAEHFGCAEESVRSAIECNGAVFGLCWRKAGAANKAYLIPTAVFVRWYCGHKFI